MVKRLTSTLKQHGYKLTRQRLSILKVISSSRSHLTPAEIYEKAAREDPNVGLVTVYRTLDILAKHGLICKIHNVVDFTNCNLEELENELSKKTGFNIEGHLLELHGTCPDCNKGEEVK